MLRAADNHAREAVDAGPPGRVTRQGTYAL
jgi:hypothetical protein